MQSTQIYGDDKRHGYRGLYPLPRLAQFCQGWRQGRNIWLAEAAAGKVLALLSGGAGMRWLSCSSAAVTERPERTAQGYRRFHCRDYGEQFNERSAGLLNRTQYPSDVVALVVLWRLRDRLTLRDLAGMFLIRGIVLSYRLEQDHRGIKGRIRCMRGFGSLVSAGRFCRGHDELRNFLRVRAFHRQHVTPDRRRLRQLCSVATVLAILAAT